MTLTLDNPPPEREDELRRRAEAESRTVRDVAWDALRSSLTPRAEREKRRHVSDLAGMWLDDPEVDRIFALQRPIDPKAWKEIPSW